MSGKQRPKSEIYPAPGMKNCARCRETKPVADFAFRKTRPGAYCKACRVVLSAAHMEKKRGVITPEDIARFWSRIEKQAEPGPLETPCWIWTGPPRNEDGYGQVHWAGKNTSPHLVALMLVGRVAPPDLPYADHMCRVRMCCNPDHLRFVTPRTNSLENNVGPWAINAAKTECAHGHPYVVGSYYVSKRGGRSCRECLRMYYLTDKMAKQLGLEPRPEWLADKEAA